MPICHSLQQLKQIPNVRASTLGHRRTIITMHRRDAMRGRRFDCMEENARGDDVEEARGSVVLETLAEEAAMLVLGFQSLKSKIGPPGSGFN
ncbi:hypothetical protein F383_26031 [Gossypium arboreum]|uniref:Uncharacterized protein n=1 Tax=Gossypium arboreum TaxID=29729 RepID=A0A0B0MUE1_GOSAR|nr:hypothetical protein F383_26031 [Gossypium arboreum]